jgi:threonine dehydrogenase-like Zn-dependent dehydrogenase
MADGAVAQALVLEAPRRLVVRELPLPNLGDDDALVRVAACGLCGTDHEQFTGALADVVVDVTAYRAALDLLASGRYPFASLPRRCVGLDDAEDLLAMAGERNDVPPVHGVLTP